MERKAKARTSSNWKAITVLNENGEPMRVFTLDNLGQLVDKMPRQRRRCLKNRKVEQAPLIKAEPQIHGPVMPIIGNRDNVNVITPSQPVTESVDLKFDDSCGSDMVGDNHGLIYPDPYAFVDDFDFPMGEGFADFDIWQ